MESNEVYIQYTMSDENANKITITGLKHTITKNTDSITQATNRMDKMEQNFTSELETFHKRITDLERGTTSTEELMKT